MNKPVNPKSPWRSLPTLPQTEKPTENKQQQIDYAAKRLARIDLDKQMRIKMRKRGASHLVRTPEEIEELEARNKQRLSEYRKKQRAQLKEQVEGAGATQVLQGVTDIDHNSERSTLMED